METSGYLETRQVGSAVRMVMEECPLDIITSGVLLQECVRIVESALGRYRNGASGLLKHAYGVPYFKIYVSLSNELPVGLLERLRLVYATGRRPWPFVGLWKQGKDTFIMLCGEALETKGEIVQLIEWAQKDGDPIDRQNRARTVQFFTSRPIAKELHGQLGIVEDEIQGNREGELPTFWYQLKLG